MIYKKLRYLLPLFLFASFTYAQEPVDELGNNPCGHTHETEKLLENASPNDAQRYQESRAELEAFTQQYIQNNPVQAKNQNRVISYTIPVVFHIVHAGGPENISDEQIEDALFIMNRDYQLLNADTSVVVQEFRPIMADIEVEFKLAQVDPFGECTNGITRTFANLSTDPNASGNDRMNAIITEHGEWPGDEYLNIIVAAEIGGAAGYTYKPNNWIGASMGNAIHVLSHYVGSIGTGSLTRSRTLTHEVGHWLNLDHPWGSSNTPAVAGNCAIDDGVADTPLTMGWTSCNLSGTTCDGNLDNVQNYMDYSYCTRMFTAGQKVRMHAALNSGIGGRDNIWSASNLLSTGVDNPDEFCKAEFGSNMRQVCVGSSIDFEDLSFDAPNSWNWSFPGASPSTSTSQNPTVVYDTPGTYAVTLTASDGAVTDTETKTAFIEVLPQVTSLPFLESFETNTVPGDFWTTTDNGGAVKWNRTMNAGYTDNYSVRLFNYAQQVGDVDAFVSQSFDLSNVDPAEGVTMSFRYAYRKRNTNNYEVLRVYVSSDCGENWSQRKILFGSQLGNIISPMSWIPQSQDDWETVHLTNITSQFWTSNFRVRFEFESDGGNNIYIDDINIYDGAESDEILETVEFDLIQNFVVFPNPSEGEVNINFSTAESMKASVVVTDLVGKIVKVQDIVTVNGQNKVKLAENLASGTYLVSVSLENGSRQTKKLVIR